MGQGLSPFEAAEISIVNMASKEPNFTGAVIAMNIFGEYGKISQP